MVAVNNLLKRAFTRLARSLRSQPRRLPYPICTDHLHLRPFVESDGEAMQNYRGDAGVLRFQARTRPYDLSETYSKLQSRQRATQTTPREGCFLAIVSREDGALLGECSLFRPSLTDVHYLSFMLRQDAWGCGYASEAAQAMLQFGFTYLHVHHVVAGCHPDNAASIRVLTKIGMAAKEPRSDFLGAPPGIASCVFETTARTWLPVPADKGIRK